MFLLFYALPFLVYLFFMLTQLTTGLLLAQHHRQARVREEV
jgi:hypothetical protein